MTASILSKVSGQYKLYFEDNQQKYQGRTVLDSGFENSLPPISRK